MVRPEAIRNYYPVDGVACDWVGFQAQKLESALVSVRREAQGLTLKARSETGFELEKILKGSDYPEFGLTEPIKAPKRAIAYIDGKFTMKRGLPVDAVPGFPKPSTGDDQ